jgi:tRNA(Ile)-lysidine synthase
MLLNLSRGTGLDGMRGIPPVRGRIIRPLIEQSRPQIEAFCQQCSCLYVTDSSNACMDFSRNRLRSQVIPVLTSINSAFESAAGRMMRLAACDADYLEKSAKHMMDKASEPVGLNIDLIENLHPALRTRVIRMFLGQAGHRCDEQTVLRADRIVQAKRGRMQMPDGSLLAVSRGFLKYDTPASYRPGHSRHISLCDIEAPIGVRLSDGRWLTLRPLSLHDIKLFVNYIPLEFKNVVDYDKISHSLQLRGRRPKDTLRQWGRGCTKSLKKLINEAGVPLSARDGLAVLADNDQLIWAEGFGVRDSAALTIHTKRALLIEISGEEIPPCIMTSNAY